MAGTSLDHNARFELFPKLPTELRLKIWKYSEYNNRREVIVKVRVIFDGKRLPMNFPGVKYSASTPTPPTLHACHESREVGLESYKPAILEINEDKEERKIYVNFETDMLYLQIWPDNLIPLRYSLQSILSAPFTTTYISYLLSRCKLRDQFADCYPDIGVEQHATGLHLRIASVTTVSWNAARDDRRGIVIAMISKLNDINMRPTAHSLARIGHILNYELVA